MERRTRQRDAIKRAIERAGHPLSPREILDAAKRAAPALGMATVYRTLKSLLDSGVVAAVDLPGEAPRYEIAGKAHHHHFRCRECERVFEVEGCPADLSGLTPRGFVLLGHELTLFGLCKACVPLTRTTGEN